MGQFGPPTDTYLLVPWSKLAREGAKHKKWLKDGGRIAVTDNSTVVGLIEPYEGEAIEVFQGRSN